MVSLVHWSFRALGHNAEMTEARRQLQFLLSAPVHITLVYPEEMRDEPTRLKRTAAAAQEVAQFSIWLESSAPAVEPGVSRSVIDPSGSWHRLRDMILDSPSTTTPVEPHATVDHPADLGNPASVGLDITPVSSESVLSEIAHTETDPLGVRVLQRFTLAGTQPTRVVAGLLRRNGQLLLCHRQPGRAHYPDVWDLPGGHVEVGEAMTHALVRELDEELGVSIEPPNGPPWRTILIDDIEVNIYILDRWRGEPRNAAVHEHDEIRWVDLLDTAHLELAHHSYSELFLEAGEV